MPYCFVYCTRPRARSALGSRAVNAIRHGERVVTSTYYYLFINFLLQIYMCIYAQCMCILFNCKYVCINYCIHSYIISYHYFYIIPTHCYIIPVG